jgi:hypothetical protein
VVVGQTSLAGAGRCMDIQNIEISDVLSFINYCIIMLFNSLALRLALHCLLIHSHYLV